MDNNIKDNLKEVIKELLFRMDFEPDSPVKIEEGDFLMAKIESNEAGFLIGQGGENLEAFQYLAKIIMAKKFGADCPHFMIDVNDYRAERIQFIKDTALRMAEQVRSEKIEKAMEPMPAFERRLVHLALEDQPGIIVESSGIAPNRKIVIKPAQE